MKRSLHFATLITTLLLTLPGSIALADGPVEQDGGHTRGYAEADCYGGGTISCSGTVGGFSDGTSCSNPGYVTCNGNTTYCCPSSCSSNVSLSCTHYGRYYQCNASVSGSIGQVLYQWTYSGVPPGYLNPSSSSPTTQDNALASWPPVGCFEGDSTWSVTATDACGTIGSDSETQPSFFCE